MSNRGLESRPNRASERALHELSTIKSAGRHIGRRGMPAERGKSKNFSPCCDFSQLPTLAPIGQSERGYPPASVAPAGGLTQGGRAARSVPLCDWGHPAGRPRAGRVNRSAPVSSTSQSCSAALSRMLPSSRYLSRHTNASACFSISTTMSAPQRNRAPVHVLPSRSVLVTPAMCE